MKRFFIIATAAAACMCMTGCNNNGEKNTTSQTVAETTPSIMEVDGLLAEAIRSPVQR